MKKNCKPFINEGFSKYKRGGLFISMMTVMVLLNACSKNSNETYVSTPVPTLSVNISLNINSSPYSALAATGGCVYISGGYRGILLYRENASTIMAFDRTCTYDLPDAGGIVYSENNGTAVCVDCGSIYDIVNGVVAQGPSTLGLQSYKTVFNTSTGILTITN